MAVAYDSRCSKVSFKRTSIAVVSTSDLCQWASRVRTGVVVFVICALGRGLPTMSPRSPMCHEKLLLSRSLGVIGLVVVHGHANTSRESCAHDVEE